MNCYLAHCLSWRRLYVFFAVISSTVITGCSGSSQHLKSTFEVALFGIKAQGITTEYVQSLPYASLYISMNNDPEALVILGWVEPGMGEALALKWVSGTQEMVVTEAGRVTKTLNLPLGNLMAIITEQADPLSLGLLDHSVPHRWDYYLRWQDKQQKIHQQPVVSTFSLLGKEVTLLPGGEKELIKVDERVFFPLTGQSYHNLYWLTPQTGEVFASRQQLGPNGVELHLSIAKPYAGE